MNHRIAHLAVRLAPPALDGGEGAQVTVQLLPAGLFRAQDGRPQDIPGWRLDAAAAQRLIAQAQARANPTVIDYEHQTLHSKANGQPAPAAGWFTRLEWREGEGLFAADVQWTAKARAMIGAGEYRFISPVFGYDRQGRVTHLYHAALTNDPALDGMAAVAASLAPQENLMDDLKERLLYLLNLPITTTDQELLDALDKLKAMVTAQGDGQAAATFAGLEPYLVALRAEAQAARDQVAALKAGSQPLEVVEGLKAEVAALRAEHHARQVDDLVKPALADGRLLPAQEQWARELGQGALAALQRYLETAQPIAALTATQTAGKAPEAKPALSDEEWAACRLLGQDPDAYAAFKAGLNR